MSETERPILVLGSGQRCGSTLVQRLLTSHADVMIWGEHAGETRAMMESVGIIRDWSRGSGRRGREELGEKGYQGFIANVTPPAETVAAAFRAFVEVMFMETARELGKTRWGFKEVRYTLQDLVRFSQFYPEFSVIHIVRDPREVLSSLDEWERTRPWEWRRGHTERAIQTWLEVSSSLISAEDMAGISVHRIRYEDMMPNPKPEISKLCAYIGLDEAALDIEVMRRKVHREGEDREADRTIRTWAQLPSELKALVERYDLAHVAMAYGYDL